MATDAPGRVTGTEPTAQRNGEIRIVCHECETPLRAVLEASEKAAPEAGRPSPTFARVWGTTLDLAER